MTVAVIDGQLKVTLSDVETVKYNIDCVFFEKASKQSEKALVGLLKAAAKSVGFNTAAQSFAIEIYPVFSGGCEIYFIPEASKSASVRATARGWSVYEFDTSEAALTTCELLYRDLKTRYCTSQMYKYNGKYQLAVKNASPILNRQIAREFADRGITSRSERNKILEYGKPIAPKNAIFVIGSAMCRDGISE